MSTCAEGDFDVIILRHRRREWQPTPGFLLQKGAAESETAERHAPAQATKTRKAAPEAATQTSCTWGTPQMFGLSSLEARSAFPFFFSLLLLPLLAERASAVLWEVFPLLPVPGDDAPLCRPRFTGTCFESTNGESCRRVNTAQRAERWPGGVWVSSEHRFRPLLPLTSRRPGGKGAKAKQSQVRQEAKQEKATVQGYMFGKASVHFRIVPPTHMTSKTEFGYMGKMRHLTEGLQCVTCSPGGHSVLCPP